MSISLYIYVVVKITNIVPYIVMIEEIKANNLRQFHTIYISQYHNVKTIETKIKKYTGVIESRSWIHWNQNRS